MEATGARKRTITSCSNCHRRKQKCNRRRPCNNCTVRKVGHECYYETLPWSHPQIHHEQSNLADVASRPGAISAHDSATVQDQFGYSSIAESNAFIEAGKALQDSTESKPSITLSGSITPTWQKYWQIIAEIPSIPVVDDLIGTYFSEINWLYGIIEPYYFKRSLKEWRNFTSSSSSTPIEAASIDLRCFPALLFQTLAITLLYVPRGFKMEESAGIGTVELSQKYSDNAVAIIQLLRSQGPTIISAQHDLIRAAFLKNRGRGAEAWNSLSNAIRKAQDLNLHRRGRLSANPSPEEFWSNEWRKRVWIMLFMWDSNMSMLLGRPRLINAVDCDINPPIDHDIPANLERIQDLQIPAYRTITHRLPTSMSINLFMYSLSHKIHEIRTLGADKRGLKDYTIVQRLHSEILAIAEELPIAIRISNPELSWDLEFPILPSQREKVYAVIYSLIMALHRPHVAKHMESRHQAQEAALKLLDSQQRFFEVMNRNNYAYFGNAFYTIDAVIVLSTVVSVFPSKDVNALQRIVFATQQAVGRMCLLETENEMAPSGIKILRSCYQVIRDEYHKSKKYLDSVLATASPPNFERQSLASNTGQTDYQSFAHPEMGDGFHGNFSGFDNTPQIQTDFTQSFGQMDPMGGNEFDASYWIEYRQQVYSEALDTLDEDMNWDGLLG